jgi:hypothetical protein
LRAALVPEVLLVEHAHLAQRDGESKTDYDGRRKFIYDALTRGNRGLGKGIIRKFIDAIQDEVDEVEECNSNPKDREAAKAADF